MEESFSAFQNATLHKDLRAVWALAEARRNAPGGVSRDPQTGERLVPKGSGGTVCSERVWGKPCVTRPPDSLTRVTRRIGPSHPPLSLPLSAPWSHLGPVDRSRSTDGNGDLGAGEGVRSFPCRVPWLCGELRAGSGSFFFHSGYFCSLQSLIGPTSKA